MTATDLKNEIEKSKQLMTTLHDEIKVKIHLAGMDAKEVWSQLSKEAEQLGHGATEASHSALVALNGKLRKLADSLNRK